MITYSLFNFDFKPCSVALLRQHFQSVRSFRANSVQSEAFRIVRGADNVTEVGMASLRRWILLKVRVEGPQPLER